MKVGVFHPNLGIPLIDSLMESVIQGFERTKCDFFIHRGHDYKPCDVAIRWGMHSLRFPQTTMYRYRMDQEHKGPIGIIELGFLGDREKFFQFGFGGIGGRAKYFHTSDPQNGRKFNSLYRITVERERLKRKYDYILILGQVPWDTSVQHINYVHWLYRTIRLIQKETSMQIIFRPHPKHPDAIDIKPLQSEMGVVVSDPRQRDLEWDLRGARCAVAFNSNSLVESVIYGTPIIAFDHGSMVYDLAEHSPICIENAELPDRQSIILKLQEIANCQWTELEWAQNIPWQNAKSKLYEDVYKRQL